MAEEKKLKIVIFGSFGAGKTTLIRTIDPESTHVEANCAGGTTTIALDFGRIQENGCHIHLFGTPGQERFEFAREIIAAGMDGAVLVVDAAAPADDFTRHLSDTLHVHGVPFVVFLNKYDAAGADSHRYAGLFGAAPVLPVSALDRQQSMDAILQFATTLPAHVRHHEQPVLYHKN